MLNISILENISQNCIAYEFYLNRIYGIVLLPMIDCLENNKYINDT